MLNRVAAAEIGILGYACRLPGADTPSAFWNVLREGRCVVGRIGPERWSDLSFVNPDRMATGFTYTAAAAVLDDVWSFDAGFFGLSPREAAQMDPQQRVMLEVAWEALEMAGLPPSRVAGRGCGVFVGSSGLDYGTAGAAGDPAAADAQFMTGNTLSIIANRVAHVLDAQGPSYVIDTACSSSLFAFHAACEAIRSGEIEIAIVGGVNMLLSPMPFVGFSRAGMLSPGGLCRPFDAGADGYVRGEGAVAFVIGDMEMARAQGDPVRGVVLGSGINSDGGAGGLSVPSCRRQEELMRKVCAAAGLDPDDLAFVEAHGTGTAVGDPIEARAIGRAFGARRAAPLPIGSAKSNFGHLEPASGLVGLLKAQMALEAGELPRTLHVETPNPAIPFAALNLALTTEPVALPARGAPWAAGVNSFGFGGANAHVAIRQPTAEEAAAPDDAPAPATQAPLILSAASEEALRATAARWRGRLAQADVATTDALVAAAAHRRARLARRLVVVEGGRAARVAALDAFLDGREDGGWVVEQALAGHAAPVAFVFSGNGSQWPGMGLAAYGADAAFRDSFDATAALVAAEGGPDLEAELRGPDLEARLTLADVAQPLLLAIQIATVDALAARGVTPMAVAGHSVGEVAASWACGALSRAQAARLAVRRARRQAPLLGTGGMAAVLASAEAVEALIAARGLRDVAVAADNSPRGATVSGAPEAIDAIIAAARAERVAARRLRVDYPFHGPLMERIREPLLADLADLAPSPSRIPFVSTTEGAVCAGEALDADYWWRNARQPVLFRQAALALTELGAACFVEIGPQPSLQNYVADTLSAQGARFVTAPTLRRQGRGAEDFAVIAARIAALGGAVDDARLFGPPTAMRVDPPLYPWSRKVHRMAQTPEALNVLRAPAARPLLGWRARADEGAWRAVFDLAEPERGAWLADHAVDGQAAFPAAGFVELALEAAAEVLGDGPVELSGFEVLRPLALPPGGRVELRTALDPASGAVRIASRPHLGAGDWTLHAQTTARSCWAETPPPAPAASPADAPDPTLYAALAGVGLDYGAVFRRVGGPRSGAEAGSEAGAALTRSALARGRVWSQGRVLDPTDLDAAMHLLGPLLQRRAEPGLGFLPSRFERVIVHRPGALAARAEARLLRVGARSAQAEFVLRDADGAAIAELRGARFAAVRLRRRADAETPFWRQTLVAPAGEIGAGDPWADPQARLAALGLATSDAPDPDAGALIVEAACRRIAWDAAAARAQKGGVRAALRALSPARRAALLIGIDALAEDGGYDPAADRLADAPPVAPFEALVEALMLEAPERAADLGDLLNLRAALLGEAGDAAPAHPPRESAALETAWRTLRRAAEDLLRARAPTARLRALALGHPPRAVAEALCAGAESGARIVALSDAADPEALAARLTEAQEVGASFDLVLAAGALGQFDAPSLRRLAGAMAPGALLLAVEPEPDLAAAMRAALAGDPRAEQVVETGLSRARPDWRGRLFAAGLVEAYDTALASAAVAARAISARAPAAHGARAEPAAAPAPRALVVLADAASAEFAATLTARLAALGVDVETATDAASVRPGAECVALAGAVDGSNVETTVARAGLLSDLLGAGKPSRLWLVTRAGLAGGGEAQPAQAAAARIARCLTNERPDLDLRVLDLDPSLDAAEAGARLAAALAAPSAERELRLTAQGARAPRVEPAPDIAARAARARAGGAPALRLDAGHGGLEALRWRPASRRAPGAGEIEVEVRAAGLNFRDVMWAMGVLPEEAIEDGFASTLLGMECAGVVTRAGAGAGFVEGDRVIAFAAGAFATHVVVPAEAAAPAPRDLDFAAAASLPVVFGTAWRALVDLGQLQAGESVLIHGGAGGVGLAALQIAQARGARVFATAGSPEKRALLRMLGAEAVFDSRTLRFADQLMAATGGEGVDVALNSLSGEAMERTLGCLKPFGRFVELGKRDFYADTRIGLRPMRRNISYFGVDLDAMLALRPGGAGRLLREVAQRVDDGAFSPPPFRLFEGADALDAFRLMQRAGHIGKIVIAPPPAPAVEEAAAPAQGLRVRADGAYLVTGGARGFGLALAERLVARGARSIWLTSRSGAAALDADAVAASRVAAMRDAGAQVEIAACDASDAAATAALLARIAAQGAPLRGVAHAAMTLDDALFDKVDAARLRAALAPKLGGALALDQLTRGCDLDFFLLFSSVAALFGNPGQSAYVAANAALEALAAARRAEGLPGFAAAFGPIADVGVLAADPEARARLERRGAGLMRADQALDALETAMEGAGPDDAALAIAPMRWGALKSDLAILRTPLFSTVDLGGAEAAVAAGGEDLRAMVAGLDDAAALRKLTGVFCAEAAIILRQSPEEIDPARPMAELGFDSLMAVELKLSAEEKYGVSLPVLSLSDGATLAAIAARTLADLRGTAAAAQPVEVEIAEALAARHLGAEAAAAVGRRLADTVEAEALGVDGAAR
ncbi:MAG: SDR family NAD(P)-dependent oxidoreductase [Rubrimonas sp.]|uniref:SDR family NAD(P)-dependent oxidoreductase n=1 Tax=Rubrimonas sp. TaxID=2036015 RepID=UPI002FDD99D7